MPVDSPRYKAAKSADQYVEELDLYVEELEAKHKNQAEVKHAVNEAQQIADTLKQSMQTVKSSREQRVERIKNQADVKQAVNEAQQIAQQIADTFKQSEQTAKSYTAKFKPVKFKPVVYIQNHIPKATNYGSGEFTTGGYIVWAVCVILGFMLFVMFDKFVQWIKRKLKQCFERLKQCFKRS